MKNNKIQSVFTLLALGVLLFAGCQKDGMTTLRLRIADFASDSKVYMDGNTPRWVAGDEICINGSRYTIASNSTTTVSSNYSNYKAVYPYSIFGSLSNGVYTLNIPRNQTYRVSGGNQIVDAPMAANADAATSGTTTTLNFKNIGALLRIQVVNNPTDNRGALTVDKITVTANLPLWGTATLVMEQLTDGNYNPVYTINAQPTPENRTIYLNCGSQVTIPRGSSHVFYVSVPAVPEGAQNKFTIAVHAYNNDGEETFTLSQPYDGMGDIRVNKMASVPFNFSDATGTWQRSDIPAGAIRNGVFTIKPATGNTAAEKVYFASGNLQYYCGGSDNSKWRIAPNQWDVIGTSNNGRNSANCEEWIDLFGWGTSGYTGGGNCAPYVFESDGSYGPSSGTLLTDVYDWGLHNVIYNGDLSSPSSTGEWRTLTYNQWRCLIGETVNNIRGRQVRGGRGLDYNYSYVTVRNGSTLIPGLLIYPDDFSANDYPSGVLQTTAAAPAEIQLSEYRGCVFLPTTGIRLGDAVTNAPGQNNPIGYYWCADVATAGAATRPYTLVLQSTGWSFDNTSNMTYRYVGHAVRLVSDVPASTSSK